ncbi:MAG: hypothetical protein ABIQ51_23870 [Mesorhizobium sp.]
MAHSPTNLGEERAATKTGIGPLPVRKGPQQWITFMDAWLWRGASRLTRRPFDVGARWSDRWERGIADCQLGPDQGWRDPRQ